MAYERHSNARATAWAELVRTLRANFSDDNLDAALWLAEHTPSGQSFTTRTGAAAYRRGLIAGLGADSLKPEPVNPYRARSSNFARGGNNPHTAWAAGLLDGQRVRLILHYPEKAAVVVPAIRWNEVRQLPAEVRDVVVAALDKHREPRGFAPHEVSE